MSLINELKNKEFRDAFVTANIEDGIAFQVRALRKNRDWTQTELAEAIGTSPSAVSRLEDPDAGLHSVATLLKLASAFDVALLIRFVPFSKLLHETRDLSPEALSAPSFKEDDFDGDSYTPSYGLNILSHAASPPLSKLVIAYSEHQVVEKQRLPGIPPEPAWAASSWEDRA